jgi:hypothetical protein
MSELSDKILAAKYTMLNEATRLRLVNAPITAAQVEQIAESLAAVEWRVNRLEEIAHWAQATLTALNVGNVESESRLHKKLREVLIAYREQADAERAGVERD